MDGAGNDAEVTPDEVSELRTLVRLVVQLRYEMAQHDGEEFGGEQVATLLEVVLGAALSKRTIERAYEPERVVYEARDCPKTPDRPLHVRVALWN